METELKQGDELKQSDKIIVAPIHTAHELKKGDWVEHEHRGEMEIDGIYTDTEDGKEWAICKCSVSGGWTYIHFLLTTLKRSDKPRCYFITRPKFDLKLEEYCERHVPYLG